MRRAKCEPRWRSNPNGFQVVTELRCQWRIDGFRLPGPRGAVLTPCHDHSTVSTHRVLAQFKQYVLPYGDVLPACPLLTSSLLSAGPAECYTRQPGLGVREILGRQQLLSVTATSSCKNLTLTRAWFKLGHSLRRRSNTESDWDILAGFTMYLTM